MTTLPSDRFKQNVGAAVAYWQTATQDLDEATLHQINVESQNLLQAVRFGLALPHTWRAAAMVVLQVFHLAERRGYWLEWTAIIELSLATDSFEDASLKSQLLNRLGQMYRFQNQPQKAIVCHQQATSIVKAQRNTQLLAESYFNLSEAYLNTREYERAEHFGREALALFKEINASDYWMAAVLNTLGKITHAQGDLESAEVLLTKAVHLRRQLGEPIPLARTINALAITMLQAGNDELALNYLKETENLLAASPYKIDKAMVCINLGALYFNQNQWEEAEAVLRRVDLPYLRQVGQFVYCAAVAHTLGNVLLKQGKLLLAKEHLEQAVALWTQINNEIELANSTETLAEVYIALDQKETAVPLLDTAISLLTKFPDDARAQRLYREFKVKQHDLDNGMYAKKPKQIQIGT